MNTIASFADFLLAKWLWSMTFDWYHLIVNLFLMFFLIRNMGKLSTLRSFLFSLILQVFAFGMFTLIVVGFMYYGLNWEYVLPPVPELPVANYVMRACLWLGIIYSVFQTLFILIMHAYNPFRRMPYLVIIWMGNFVSAIISYCCILLLNSLHL